MSNWVSLLFGALCATLRRRQALVLEHRLLRQPRAAALRARNRWGCTGAGPLADPAARLVWEGFERSLLATLPDARRVATTWEDVHPCDVWRRSLAAQGYAPADSRRLPAVFMKRAVDGP